MEDLDIKALVALAAGKRPASGRTFAPESMRRKSNAEEIAGIVTSEVMEPIREWIEELREMLEAAETVLEEIETSAGELEGAETGDEREDAYAELDGHFSTLLDALDDLGVKQ